MPVAWSDYERVHADRRNLRLHLFAVPIFLVSFPATLILLGKSQFVASVLTLLLAIASMVIQRIGHSKEAIEPEPFNGPIDFLRRWFSEQYFKFPVFVLSGRWWRQYQAGR